MQNDYVCLNSKTFEFETEKNIIPVDGQLAKVLSTLNKKGYYTQMFKIARIGNPFLISTLIHELKEQGLLNITNETKDKIKNIIKQSDYESTLIVFKEEYKFDNLPEGYKLIGTNLMYNLEILKDNDDIEMKTLVELDREHQESIKNLEKWAFNLSNISKI